MESLKRIYQPVSDDYPYDHVFNLKDLWDVSQISDKKSGITYPLLRSLVNEIQRVSEPSQLIPSYDTVVNILKCSPSDTPTLGTVSVDCDDASRDLMMFLNDTTVLLCTNNLDNLTPLLGDRTQSKKTRSAFTLDISTRASKNRVVKLKIISVLFTSIHASDLPVIIRYFAACNTTNVTDVVGLTSPVPLPLLPGIRTLDVVVSMAFCSKE